MFLSTGDEFRRKEVAFGGIDVCVWLQQLQMQTQLGKYNTGGTECLETNYLNRISTTLTRRHLRSGHHRWDKQRRQNARPTNKQTNRYQQELDSVPGGRSKPHLIDLTWDPQSRPRHLAIDQALRNGNRFPEIDHSPRQR